MRISWWWYWNKIVQPYLKHWDNFKHGEVCFGHYKHLSLRFQCVVILFWVGIFLLLSSMSVLLNMSHRQIEANQTLMQLPDIHSFWCTFTLFLQIISFSQPLLLWIQWRMVPSLKVVILLHYLVLIHQNIQHDSTSCLDPCFCGLSQSGFGK